MKKILIIFFLINFLLINFSFSQDIQYFNPFRFGIKTVKGLQILDDENLRQQIRKKAADLLNAHYNTTTFQVMGERIINSNNLNVNKAVEDSYGSWPNLLEKAAEMVFADETLLPEGYRQYVGWKVVNLDITPDGKLNKIYIAPAEYLEGFPSISPCQQGVGQCILFVFDRVLRILYTVSLALGVILLMWAGILYVTKPGEAKNIHSRVQWGVIGIIVSILSFTAVIALENWLISGIAMTPGGGSYVSQVEGPTEEMGGGGGMQEATISPPTKSTLIIDSQTAKIDERGKFSVFVSLPKGSQCDLNYSFYNLTKGENLGSPFPLTISAKMFISYDLSTFRNVEPGDRIRVIFESNDCNLNITQINLTYPKPTIVVTPTKKIPTISFNIKEIRASQYIRVEIPDNLKDALEELLGITVLQRNIYQPPFNMYIEYTATTDGNPPDRYGSCQLYGVMRGTSVTSFTAGKKKAATLYIFNRDFTITLNYTPGKSSYNVSKYISPPSNTLGFLYVKFYDYEGECNVEGLPFEKVFDIETGKIYLPGGSGWDTIKQILGLE